MRNCYFLSGLGPLQLYHNCTTIVVQLWYNCGGPRPDMRVSQTGHESVPDWRFLGDVFWEMLNLAVNLLRISSGENP